MSLPRLAPWRPPENVIGLGQLALTMMLVGVNVVAGKLLAQALPVPTVLLLRCVLASLVLLPLSRRDGGGWAGVPVLLNLGLQAATGTVAYNMLLLAGLRRTGALQAGLVLSTLPAVVALAAAALLRERLHPRRWLAAVLAAGGMAALALARGGAGSGDWRGDLLVFGAVLAETGWILLTRLNAAAVGLRRGALGMQLFGVAMLAPIAGGDALARLPALLGDPRLLALLVFHALTASVASVLLWYAGMRRVPANLAGIFTVLLPATAAALAVGVLGERFTAPLGAGFALMLFSILLATWPARRPEPASG